MSNLSPQNVPRILTNLFPSGHRQLSSLNAGFKRASWKDNNRYHEYQGRYQSGRAPFDQGSLVTPYNIAAAGALATVGYVVSSKRNNKEHRVRVNVDPKDYPTAPPPHPDTSGNVSDGELTLGVEEYLSTETVRIEPSLLSACDASQINANKVIEDRVCAAQITMADGKKCFFGAVIDGHGGPHVADYVQRSLPRYLQHFVDKHKISSKETTRIAKVLPEVYLALDNDICRVIRARTDLLYSRTAKIGACCLGVFVTPTAAVVANAGDCEGIVGFNKPIEGKKRTFVPLAEPHSANLPSEQERLRREHPGENDIVRCKRSQSVPKVPSTLLDRLLNAFGILGNVNVPDVCYVKGRLQPTRCFGDFHLKAEEFAFDHELNRPLVHPPYSFPYITAMPEVFTIKLSKGRIFQNRAKFLTLCCDGVYDFLTHQQVEDSVRSALKDGTSVSAKLVEDTLTQASRDNGMTLNKLKSLNPDKKRRHHDDTSVLHIDLEALNRL